MLYILYIEILVVTSDEIIRLSPLAELRYVLKLYSIVLIIVESFIIM